MNKLNLNITCDYCSREMNKKKLYRATRYECLSCQSCFIIDKSGDLCYDSGYITYNESLFFITAQYNFFDKRYHYSAFETGEKYLIVIEESSVNYNCPSIKEKIAERFVIRDILKQRHTNEQMVLIFEKMIKLRSIS